MTDPGPEPDTGPVAPAIDLGRPPARDTRSATRKRTRRDPDSAKTSNNASFFKFTGQDEGQEMRIDEVAWLVTGLKTIIVGQNQALEALKTGQEEIKASLENQRTAMDAQKATMEGQISQLKEQIEALKGQLTHTSVTTPTWASVAASQSPPRSASASNSSPTLQSVSPNSSASQTNQQDPRCTTPPTGDAGVKASGLPGMTIDTRRMKDKSGLALTNICDTEERIKAVIQAFDATREVRITGIQVRGHNVRVLTGSEKEAALLRTNDTWVNQLFEGARTRGEDWHPVKIDDVVKAVVVKEDGHTLKDTFAQTFCEENGLTGVMEAFWLSKGNKLAGSMAVYLASREEAQRILANRLVKVGGQIAFASGYQRIARPTRCYNCNQYGHYQSRCANHTTCGKCSREHRSDECISSEKKCPACGDAHTVTDPGCPVYRREKARLAAASRQPESQASATTTHE